MMLEIRPLNNLSIHLDRLIQNRLWLKVLIGLFLGAGIGIILNPATGLVSSDFSNWLANWLDLPGQLFMRLVQMVMIPLIFTSIITGIIIPVIATFHVSLNTFDLFMLADIIAMSHSFKNKFINISKNQVRH